MENKQRIADRLWRAIHGPIWHGPAVGALLVGISHSHAAATPVRGAHAIGKFVLHETLANTTALRPHEAWDGGVGTTKESVIAVLDGVIQHTSYHGGQVVSSKRAL